MPPPPQHLPCQVDERRRMMWIMQSCWSPSRCPSKKKKKSRSNKKKRRQLRPRHGDDSIHGAKSLASLSSSVQQQSIRIESLLWISVLSPLPKLILRCIKEKGRIHTFQQRTGGLLGGSLSQYSRSYAGTCSQHGGTDEGRSYRYQFSTNDSLPPKSIDSRRSPHIK